MVISLPVRLSAWLLSMRHIGIHPLIQVGTSNVQTAAPAPQVSSVTQTSFVNSQMAKAIVISGNIVSGVVTHVALKMSVTPILIALAQMAQNVGEEQHVNMMVCVGSKRTGVGVSRTCTAKLVCIVMIEDTVESWNAKDLGRCALAKNNVVVSYLVTESVVLLRR